MSSQARAGLLRVRSPDRGIPAAVYGEVTGPERRRSPFLGRRGDGRWLLSTTDDPLDWTFERWCPEEAAVIEALGPEHFFDPETGRLPMVTPMLPRLAPHRCSYLEFDTNERVEHDPDQK